MFAKLSRTTCNSLEDLVDYWEQVYEESTQHPDAQFLAHLKWKGGGLTGDYVRYLFSWKYGPVPSWNPRPVIKRLREREKVMRHPKRAQSAEKLLESLRVYYNFVRSHVTLDGHTPAQQAAMPIQLGTNHWLDLIRQAVRHHLSE
jgi:hypothetical protein